MTEIVGVISKDGFFLVMERAQCVFIPPINVTRITFNLIDTEGGS